jgi:hypothetical protein
MQPNKIPTSPTVLPIKAALGSTSSTMLSTKTAQGSTVLLKTDALGYKTAP